MPDLEQLSSRYRRCAARRSEDDIPLFISDSIL